MPEKCLFYKKDILTKYLIVLNPPFDIDINSIYQIWGSDYIVEKT